MTTERRTLEAIQEALELRDQRAAAVMVADRLNTLATTTHEPAIQAEARREALEEAARLAEETKSYEPFRAEPYNEAGRDIATAIRALLQDKQS